MPADLADESPAKLTVADLLRAHGPRYAAEAGDRLPLPVRSALAQMVACGTGALGSHAWRCASCGETRVAHNACRHRHCPSCGAAKRAAWFDEVEDQILPVTHFHVVFTVPHELSRLMLANRRELYGLLFRAAWETLRLVALDPRHLGAEVGAILTLHTWGQQLDHHPHVHAVVPGGGLSLDGTRWIAVPSPKYFLPVKVLSRVFRGKFLAGVRALREAGQLRMDVVDGESGTLADTATFERFVSSLHARDWVVFSQPPAEAHDGPESVLKYLARYVAGSAIGDSRLISHDPAANGGAGRVVFWAKNYRAGGGRMQMSLTGTEFVRRYALHILPKGLTRVRYYGLLAPRDRDVRLAHCRERIAEQVGQAATIFAERSTSPEPVIPEAPRCCPSCGEPTWECGSLADSSRPSAWEVYRSSPFYVPRATPHPPP